MIKQFVIWYLAKKQLEVCPWNRCEHCIYGNSDYICTIGQVIKTLGRSKDR